MEDFEIVFYKTADGEVPIEDFLDSLSDKMRAKVGSDISRVLYFFMVGHRIVLTNGLLRKHRRRRDQRSNVQKDTGQITSPERRTTYERRLQ